MKLRDKLSKLMHAEGDSPQRLAYGALPVAAALVVWGVLSGAVWVWKSIEDPAAAAARSARLQRSNENIEEFYMLRQRLTHRTRKLDCSPAPDTHGLRCVAAEGGVRHATLVGFNVPLSANLPLVGITWRSRTRSELVLTYSTEIPREQRLAILKAIPPLETVPAGHI